MALQMVALTCFGLVSACTTPAPQTDSPPPNRSAAAVSQASLPELSQALASGSLSAEALVQAYQRRIDELDRAGPVLRSVLAVNPAALERARELDALHASGASAGPLHGLPILLKDNIESRGVLPTTAGSTALANNITDRDSPLVANLRTAGAIILGKTNLSQWANFRSTRSLSGWSAIGGQTRNPHVLDRNPCGSSSGSAVAVAASLAAGAVGTETNGSIICPASVNGIVGFKPTVGLISTDHIVPISSTQDTAGPMTRSVAGAAHMLDAMAGSSSTFADALDRDALNGVRVGVLRYAAGSHPGVLDRFASALQAIKDLGAELIDIDKPPAKLPNGPELARLLMTVEFKHTLNAYLASSPAELPARTLQELIDYNRESAERELGLFDQDLFEVAAKAPDITADNYLAALEVLAQASRTNGIDALLSTHSLQVLVFPSAPLPAPIDPVNGDVWPPWIGDGSTAAVAGYPHLTVPMGTVRGLPVGLSFVASAKQDARVLAFGYAYEQASRLRAAPQFLPTSSARPELQRLLDRPAATR